MFGSAYQAYYQDSRNTFVSSGQPGVVLWSSKVQDKERWLSAKQILQLQEKENRSKLKKTALESGRASQGGGSMFDTRKVGQRIAMLRKTKDMTQMELADKMMVSYQAVSNWERGNSMPDISKLPELAEILGVSLEELLGSKRKTEIIEKVARAEAPLSLEEVAEVAPVLKPSQVDEAAERSGEAEVDLKTLEELAPYFSQEKLGDWAERLQIQELSELVGLAPFLTSKQLGKLIRKMEKPGGDLNQVVALAPFLDSADLGCLVNENLDSGADYGQVMGLAPFMDKEDLIKVAARMQGAQVSASQLAGLAPFLGSETLCGLLKDLEPSQLREHVMALAPFIDSKDLTPIAREIMKTGDMRTFTALLPFIDTDAL